MRLEMTRFDGFCSMFFDVCWIKNGSARGTYPQLVFRACVLGFLPRSIYYPNVEPSHVKLSKFTTDPNWFNIVTTYVVPLSLGRLGLNCLVFSWVLQNDPLPKTPCVCDD